jgi:lysophospholipase L1-like esterase
MLRVAAAIAVAGALGAAVATSFGAAAGEAPAAQRALLLVGDSLSVGTGPYLRSRLRDYRIDGRHGVGLRTDAVAVIVEARRSSLPPVLVVSAGTNDEPSPVSAFSRPLSRILAVSGRSRCVVWPTISRPPVAGVSYDGLNGALELAAARHPNLVLVDWVGMVRRHREWLRRDGVHVTVAGYRARAEAIAAAVKTRCSA